MRNVLTRPDLQAAATAFALACTYSRAHDALAAALLEVHGSHGPQISGVVRSHFPEPDKQILRALCTGVNAASDAGYDLRPIGVRTATIWALSRAVAKRDGYGFYGPRGG